MNGNVNDLKEPAVWRMGMSVSTERAASARKLGSLWSLLWTLRLKVNTDQILVHPSECELVLELAVLPSIVWEPELLAE